MQVAHNEQRHLKHSDFLLNTFSTLTSIHKASGYFKDTTAANLSCVINRTNPSSIVHTDTGQRKAEKKQFFKQTGCEVL